MKRSFITLMTLFTVMTFASAQQASDVLRYSSTQYGGTARSIGVGNSMSVLGGDYGTLSINPAGLGVYRSSDIMLSFGYLNTSTNAKLNGNNNPEWNELGGKLTFNNIGLVLNSTPIRANSRWKTSNFSFGFNKLADFKRNIYYQGDSPGSIVTVFKNQLASGLWDEFGSALAYDAEALYDSTIGGVKRFYSDFDGKEGSTLSRSQYIKTTGRVTEMNISYGANYDDKLNIGFSLNIPFFKYTYANSYDELDANAGVPYFNNLLLKDNYTVDGTGVNLKAGIIYRPVQMFRLGLALHSPTSIAFSESHTTDFSYSYTTNSGSKYDNTANSPEGVSKYTIITPWRGIASVGIVVGKSGFITAEAEYVDYKSSRIRFDTPDSIGAPRIQELKTYQTAINDKIKAQYQPALNIRVGGEMALDIFRLRAGFNLLGNANVGESGYRKAITLGAGVRGQNAYFDIAYRNEKQTYSYQPYLAAEPARQPNVDINSTQHSITATVGFRF